MADLGKQFLDTDGLNALWTKHKKVQPFYQELGTSGTNGWVNFLTVKGTAYMNHPLVVRLLCQGYSDSTMDVQFVSANNTTPTIQYFKQRIQPYSGTQAIPKPGYTYEDVDGVRYYKFWLKKNEASGSIGVHVESEYFYTTGAEDTGILTFPNVQSNTEPAGIVYVKDADIVYEAVPAKTAVSASAVKVGTNAMGQVVLGNALAPSDLGISATTTSVTVGSTTANIPQATTTTPKMDGTAAVGTETKWAKGDHVHPTDTSRASASHTHGSITNDGKIGTTANLPVITGTGGAVTTGSFSTTASAVGTSSAAGTANTFSRGDHVHSISLATGDSDGQVKIAGSNVSVAGWDKVALSQHQGTKQYHIQVNNTSSNPKGWCPIVRVTMTSGYGPYSAIRVSGTFYYGRGNWASTYDFVVDFQAIVNISGNTAALYLGKTKMNPVPLRLIKIADRDYELQYNASVANMDYDIYYQVEGNAQTHTTFYTTYQASTSTGTAITSGKRLEGNIAYEADKLSTARTIQTDLASTSSASFDGTANITPGVTGTLPVANGGTGATTPAGAQFNLIDKATTELSPMGDKHRIAIMSPEPSATNSVIAGYRTGLTMWNYMKGKMSSDTGVNISGNAATATSAGKLTTARELAVGLSNTSTTTTFDGSANVTNIKVSGQLPVANGGTGSNTAAGARTNLSVYSKSEIDSLMSGRVEIVTELPATGKSGITYYVGPTGSGADKYDEYIWTGSAFLKVGEHSLDLSNYVNTVATSGSGSVVTGVSKSGNTVTVTKGNISLDDLSDWATETDVTISNVTYHTMWPVAPTSSNQVYGISINNGRLFRIYNNKGAYSVQAYDKDSDTTYTPQKLGIGYGTCTTAEATAAKVATLADYTLVKNGIVAVKFSYPLCASATLNINGKGAKPVYVGGAAVTATNCKSVQAGDIGYFIYDGTAYHFLGTDRAGKSSITGLSVNGRKVTYTRADGETGSFDTQDTTYSFADSYNASTNKGATVATVTNAINALDVSDISGFGAGKTLATLKEENGKISATFQNISITKSQVSDFSHTHGNIQNGGTLQTNDITIANGDKLVVTDSSDSSKVARASISFDGSTTTKALTPKGTFEAFAKSGDITTAIQALDVSSVGGDGKYISAISETDGKIAPVVETMDTAPTRGSKKAVTSDGIQTALDEKLDIDDVNSLSLTATYTEDNHRLTFNDIIFDNIYPVVGKYGLAVFKTDTTTAAIESSGDKDWLLDWRPYLIDMNAIAGETAKKPIAELRKANWLRNIDGSFAPVCGITAAQGACLDGKSASLKWGKADDYGASSDVATDVPGAFDGTEFNPAAFWNYVNSAAGLDRVNEVTGAGYRCAIEVEVTDGVTTYKYGAYGNDHIPAPWETTRTDLSVFIGRTADVYVIDGAEKYGDYMRGLCAKPVPVGTSQFDPEFFKLRRTGISPGPSTTKGGKIRNLFYNYAGTDSNTAGGGNAACFKNNGTYPRTTDASQYTTANWSRACNSGGSSGNAVPVAEGGYFALNAFLCSLEAAYKDRNLWSADRFSTGISVNDTVQNGVWNGSAATAYTTWSNGTVGSNNANGYRPKFQCMEPQIAASLAAEMGLAANTAFTWNGGEWHYEVPELTGINSLTGSSSSMNCRIYKKITEGLSSAVTSGGHYMLRCALAEGVNPTGDIWWYQGGGCELVYMTTGTTNTAYTYSFYLEPDQSKWLATSTNEKHTDGTPFPAETAYTAIITDSTAGGLVNGWSNSRTGYTPLRLTAGGSYTSGECMFNYRQIDDDSKGSSGIRSRRHVVFRGSSGNVSCSPRCLNAVNRPSSVGANIGCAAQVLLA